MRHKVVPPICRLEDLRPEKSSAFFRFSRHSPWSPASADFGSLHTKKRICLQQTYPLRSHSKKTSVLYPYVGIIQIRLRVLSDPAFSQPAFCKHPFFVSVDIINTLILGIKCYLNFLFALEEALREVPVSLQPESSRHPEYNQMHQPDTY